MVILDTNIIIDHLRQKPGTDTLLSKLNKKEGKDYLAISLITLQELYEGKSTKDETKLTALMSVLAPLKILEYNNGIAELAGTLARELARPIAFADAAIAGTCIFYDFDLFTLNVEHFKDIPELNLYYL